MNFQVYPVRPPRRSGPPRIPDERRNVFRARPAQDARTTSCRVCWDEGDERKWINPSHLSVALDDGASRFIALLLGRLLGLAHDLRLRGARWCLAANGARAWGLRADGYFLSRHD